MVDLLQVRCCQDLGRPAPLFDERIEQAGVAWSIRHRRSPAVASASSPFFCLPSEFGKHDLFLTDLGELRRSRLKHAAGLAGDAEPFEQAIQALCDC